MQAEVPSHTAAPPETLETARYVADMAARLEAIAARAHLNRLAYYLGMAKAEGQFVVRGDVQAADLMVDQKPST